MLPFGYFDLVETFPQSGCAICNLLKNDVHGLIDKILWEHTNDPFILDKMRASRGLCNEHGWQFIEMARALQVAVFYEPALDELVKIMDTLTTEAVPQTLMQRFMTRSRGSTVVSAVEPEQPCLVCDLQNANEARYTGIMVDYITDERLLQAYQASEGLCLEHFKRVVERAPVAEPFIRIQRDIWTRLQAELKDFMAKLAMQASNDAFGHEATSWRRTHALFTGAKGLFGRRCEDDKP